MGKGIVMEIKSTKDIKASKINALIFGESGVGKTTLASTLEQSTVIVSAESGLLSLKGFEIDYIEVKTLEELKESLDSVSKSKYENIFIDSLTEISQLFLENARKKYPEDRQTMKMYGHVLDTMTSFIKYCRDMEKNIFFTALDKVTQDELGKRFHVPDLVGSMSTKCAQYFDFVFHYRLIKSEDKDTRCLITGKTDNAIGKDRSGKLELMERPDLSVIINKVFN